MTYLESLRDEYARYVQRRRAIRHEVEEQYRVLIRQAIDEKRAQVDLEMALKIQKAIADGVSVGEIQTSVLRTKDWRTFKRFRDMGADLSRPKEEPVEEPAFRYDGDKAYYFHDASGVPLDDPIVFDEVTQFEDGRFFLAATSPEEQIKIASAGFTPRSIQDRINALVTEGD